MRSLPGHNHLPTASAAWWLLGIAPLLWTADLCLFFWSKNHLIEAYSYQKDDLQFTVPHFPSWVGFLRAAIPLTVLLLLALTRRVALRDAGLTLGQPRTTLLWVGFPVLLAVVSGTVLLGLSIAVLHLFQVQLPPLRLQPIAVYHLNGLGHNLLHSCLLAPLIEEPLYRGLPVAFLERFGGRWLAMLGCGVIWTVLHLIYGWGAHTIPFYFFFWGMLITWIYLHTHSIVTTILLHGLGNLFVPILFDLVVLEHHDLLLKWIWRAP